MSVRLTRVLSIAFLLAVVCPAISDTTLRWQLKEGDRFLISTESTTTITTTTRRGDADAATDTDKREVKAVRRLIVSKSPADADVFDAEIRFESIDVTSTSGGRTMHYVARREGDKKHVEVIIKSRHAMMAGRDVKELMEKFASNLLNQRVTVQVGRDGSIKGLPSGDGALYGNLPAQTPVTKAMLHAMKKLMPADEIPAMLLADLFITVQGPALPVGGQWQGKASIVEAAGLRLSRDSTFTLESLKQVDGRTVATIRETGDYHAVADRRAEVLSDLIADELRHTKRPAKVALSFKPAIAQGKSTIRFDAAAGHPISIECEKLTLPLTGEMEVTTGDRATKVAIEAAAEITSTTTWMKE